MWVRRLDVVLQSLSTGLKSRCRQGRIWVKADLGATFAARQEGAGQRMWSRAGARVTSNRAGRSAHASRFLGLSRALMLRLPIPAGLGRGEGGARIAEMGAEHGRGCLFPFPPSYGCLATVRLLWVLEMAVAVRLCPRRSPTEKQFKKH